jgi:hypothetical protein
MGVAVAEAFKVLNPPARSFEKMLDYAAFSKLDQAKQRPAPLQDFFVWLRRSRRKRVLVLSCERPFD